MLRRLTDHYRKLAVDSAATGSVMEGAAEATNPSTRVLKISVPNNEAVPSKADRVYDLLIIVDATASMTNYLRSLRDSLPQIIAISTLTDVFERIGILAYRDFDCQGKLLEWSGWMERRGPDQVANIDLEEAARRLQPIGGYDWDEAVKTALAQAYALMRDDANTVILHYADAHPHNLWEKGANYKKEQKHLSDRKSYDGFGPSFKDWFDACRRIAGNSGGRRAQVFPILDPNMKNKEYVRYYTFLASVTNGACISLQGSDPKLIAKTTVNLLLIWMGTEKSGAEVTELSGYLTRYKDNSTVKSLKMEHEDIKEEFNKFEQLRLDAAAIKQYIPRRKTPVQDFAKRYQANESYRSIVVAQLKKIIEDDVTAIGLNHVFGSLWRAVCNDRENDERDQLITLFGLKIDRISDPAQKAFMKDWLEQSYDYTAQVKEMIEKVPNDQRYPCVFLDPTLDFTSSASEVRQGSVDDRPITEFRRDELLEIGRSCDYRILRRLGRVLTQLSYVKSADELPKHIATSVEEDQLTRIPMALASEEFKHSFWTILLHIVVPGTMLSARSAALLAALAIKVGMTPLLDVADIEMLRWKNRWNNIDVPETWNTSCLSLILDADQKFIERKNIKQSSEGSRSEGLLNETDRRLFDLLVSYKLLELNLETTLTAKIGWKPEKSSMPIGPLVTCNSCTYPRSVTMMGEDDKCGICIFDQWLTPEIRQKTVDLRVSKDITEASEATWVECNVRTCRAQYIVYDVESLNVRPKCHYCRQQSRIPLDKQNEDPAPWLECYKCLNRVIYPERYRPADISKYECPACANNHSTVVDVSTTASALRVENGIEWLLKNDNLKLKDPLGNRSLFWQVSGAGLSDFTKQVALFPNSATRKLVLDGKSIQNSAALIKELESWIIRRRTEAGTCSLCFSTSRKKELMPACGRRGCQQRICTECLGAWYGLNAAGRIINIAALNCPFCRRAPTAKTLHNYGLGIHAVGGLKDAVTNAGEWVYAWCKNCACAKPYLARVCAAGAPPELTEFVCEGCVEARGRRANYREWADQNADVLHEYGDDADVDFEDEGEPTEDFKECPGCTAMVQKSYGCGHITCVCGTHWCWFCGKAPNIGIYEHMEAEHGGYYG